MLISNQCIHYTLWLKKMRQLELGRSYSPPKLARFLNHSVGLLFTAQHICKCGLCRGKMSVRTFVCLSICRSHALSWK